MGEDFLAYIQRLELMAFFAGYPLVYTLVHFIDNLRSGASSPGRRRLARLLPYAYALTGTLFLGLVLKEMTMDHAENSSLSLFPIPYLRIWGILAIVFWIPALRRGTYYSLLHSMVFFLLWLLDILKGINDAAASEIVGNDMKIYTDSLILHSISFGIVFAFFYIGRSILRKKTINTGK